MAQGLETVAGLRRRAVALCAGLGVAALGLVLPAGTIAAQVEPPQRGAPFESVWFSVGDVWEVDASSAFVGSVDSYTATSDNGAAVSVSVTGSVMRLTGLTAGVAFVEVRASNAGGSASQWIGVVSRATQVGGEELAPDSGDADEMLPLEDDDQPSDAAPDNEGAGPVPGDDTARTSTGADGGQPLTIILVAPEWCAGTQAYGATTLEQFAAFRANRDTVHRFDLSYWVIGGRAPYVVASPDAYDAASGSSGLLRMACAVFDPDSAGGERLYFAERLRSTFTVEVTDADGAKASASFLMKLSGSTLVIDNGDGTSTRIVNLNWFAEPGSSYVVGFPTVWTYVSLAPGLDLEFEGLDTEGIAHFADREYGWEVWIDLVSGAEVRRTVGAIPDANPAVHGTFPTQPVEDMEPCLPSEEGCETS